MSAATEQQVAEYGEPLVKHIVADLNLQPKGGFQDLAKITNASGTAMGFVNVYAGERIYKLTHLSIDVAPGARYFNIMLVPEAEYDVPRFSQEGMVSTHGSQVSTDLYHDIDQALNIAAIVKRTAGLTEIFNEAKASDIQFVPSRQTHMRGLCSPHFLNVFGASGEQLPTLADYARRYYGEWRKMFSDATRLDAAASVDRRRRRDSMSDVVIALDPDRNMVVQVLGEDAVCAIEQAVMY